MSDEMPWAPISLAPAEVAVETKIHDEDGERNHAVLTRRKNLWFTGPAGNGMYVYYQPTHWRHLPRPTTLYTS